jgi:type IV pilus assembly protein PilQ
VKQLRDRPPIFRADIVFEPNLPLSVLKKNGHVVAAFNDERLLDGSQILYGEGIFTPAKLVSVTPFVGTGKITTTMKFEGSFDWTGFVRPSSNSFAVFIRNSELGVTQNEWAIPSGSISNIQLSSYDGEIPGLKVSVSIQPESKFNIAIKKDALLFESQRTVQEGETVLAQEQGSVTEETPTAKPQKESEEEVWPGVMSQEKPATVSPSVEETPPPKETSEIPWDQRVSFEFNATPVRDALRLVAASNKLNMVISEGVKGKTTMKLDNVTLKQAMDKIIYTNDCDYYVDGNIITVRPIALATKAGRITKVYRLQYADAVNVAKVVRRIATSDSLVEAFHPEFLDFSEAGQNRLKYQLSTVQGIRRSSILVVTDIPEKIKEISQVVLELDRPPIQILIESKLVEVAPNYTNELGIDWDKTFNMFYSSNPEVDSKQITLQNGGTTTTSPMLKIDRTMQMGRLTAAQYVAMIDFLKTKTNSKLMSNPRLLATDNEESSISVGKTVPIARLQRGSGGQGDMVTFDYKEVSIRLNVTPHVGSNNEITMYVNPIIEEITDWKIMSGNEAPVTDKRSVNSIISVKNGETVVIGGLVKTTKTETIKRVWLLGSLPLIGRFFQHDETKDVQTDVMIFITPTIVPSNAT